MLRVPQSVTLRSAPFRSIFASDGGLQPLIDPVDQNLSQNPREQCEREGLLGKAELGREGPGQEVVLTQLR